MSRASGFTVPVRVVHFFTCLAAVAFTAWVLSGVPRMLTERSLFGYGKNLEALTWAALVMFFFAFPSARAAWRLVRRQPLVPRAVIVDHPWFWTLATLARVQRLPEKGDRAVY